MRLPRRRSDCPISSALDLLGDKWSLLVMRDVLLRGKSHYREFLASEEHIASNILADRLSRLEAAGLLERTSEDLRSGKQAFHATDKGEDLIPLLLEMMVWSAAHDPLATAPGTLLGELARDRAAAAQAIRDLGGVEAFLATLPPGSTVRPVSRGSGRPGPRHSHAHPSRRPRTHVNAA
jgi:DNA-binding HxlR family transcriptional regulator